MQSLRLYEKLLDTNMRVRAAEGSNCLSPAEVFFEAWPFSQGSVTFALVAEVSPAGKQVRGHAAETRLVQWLPCKATEAQPWLWFCYHTSTVLPSTTELKRFVAVDSASGTRRHLGCSLPSDLR